MFIPGSKPKISLIDSLFVLIAEKQDQIGVAVLVSTENSTIIIHHLKQNQGEKPLKGDDASPLATTLVTRDDSDGGA